MFNSAQHALKFAYKTLNTPIIKMSSINSMRGASGGGDMTPHDKHAQAAMVLSIVERAVDKQGLAYIKAAYGFEVLHDGPQKKDVLAVLVPAVIATFPTGMHARRGVTMMMEVYFGKGYGMRSVQRDLRCNNRRYYEYKEWIGAALDRIDRRAMDDAHRALEAAGLITEEVTI